MTTTKRMTERHRQYVYDAEHDLVVLEALAKVWDPPRFARAYTDDGIGNTVGNCICAARFAATVLAYLNVERELTVTRAYGDQVAPLPPSKRPHERRRRQNMRHAVGWGPCGTYDWPEPERLAGHAVVVTHDLLFDAAAEQLGAPGPIIAKRADPHPNSVHGFARGSAWMNERCRCDWYVDIDGRSYRYTWAPGLAEGIDREPDWGSRAPARRLATLVREIVGPCRRPRPYTAP